MTPRELDVLMHYYVMCEPHERLNAPDISEAIRYFVENQMMEPRTDRQSGYAVTEKGEYWIKSILSTPFPVCTWMIPPNTEAHDGGV